MPVFVSFGCHIATAELTKFFTVLRHAYLSEDMRNGRYLLSLIVLPTSTNEKALAIPSDPYSFQELVKCPTDYQRQKRPVGVYEDSLPINCHFAPPRSFVSSPDRPVIGTKCSTHPSISVVVHQSDRLVLVSFLVSVLER